MLRRVGRLADGGGDLFHRRGGLFQAGGGGFGAARQVDIAGGDLVGRGAHGFAGVADLAHGGAELVGKGVEGARDLRDFIVAVRGQALGQVAVAGADGVHGVAHGAEAAQRHGRHAPHHDGGNAGDQHQRDHRGDQHRAHAGGGLGLVERDDDHPVGAGDGTRAEQLGAAADLDLQRRCRAGQRGQLVRGQRGDEVGDGLERELVVGMRDDLAGSGDQHAEARRRRMDRLDVGDHGVHGDVARDHGLDAAIADHRHGEGHHQLAGAGIDIRRRDHRLAGRGGLLVPRAASGVVAGRDTFGPGESGGLVGIADVDVGKAAGIGNLPERSVGFGLQHGVLQRIDHLAVRRHPFDDGAGVAALHGGQAAVDGVFVIAAGDELVQRRIDGERGHDNGHAQGHDPGAEGSEHLGSSFVGNRWGRWLRGISTPLYTERPPPT
ncbi:hypothetical protein D3C81_1037700 [compost metagenome]